MQTFLGCARGGTGGGGGVVLSKHIIMEEFINMEILTVTLLQ